MEDNIHIFLGAIVSIFLLFIFPVYMAFEKKDDISYVLALRYTQEFVDSVRSKGYITSEMYADYRRKLAVTGNHYEVTMTHEQVKLEPLVQYYKEDEDGNLVLAKTTSKQDKNKADEDALEAGMANPSLYEIYPYSTDQDKEEFLNNWYAGLGYKKIIETYEATTQVFPMSHIEAILRVENKLWLDATTEDFVCVDGVADLNASPKKVNTCKYAYTMNENDMFTVIIKNTNITPATLIYNMVTGNALKNNTRIYVNYGGAVLNSRWFGKIDYSKMKHDDLEIYQMELKSFFSGEREFSKDAPISDYIYFREAGRGYDYMFEFETRPFDTTDLQRVGTIIPTEDITKYNFAWGTDVSDIGMEVSVGLNGICIVGRMEYYTNEVLLSYPVEITGYTKIRIRVDRRKVSETETLYKAILYVNDKRVAETEEFSSPLIIYRMGQGSFGSMDQNYSGVIRNVKLYYN